MWLKRESYERLVARAAQSEFLAKAEARAEAAESALAIERQENSKAQRHLVSMFLRREKTYPLPATAEEKAEAKAEQQAKRNEPPQLTPDLVARREAVRQYARQNGQTVEEADKAFMAQIGIQVDE